jgi:EAL domain-containing protein (putative c-di-GMP-specific phosphodiesterase class I)
MENPQETIRTLRAIKDMGVSLSIDDFGTGYSSLAYLKLFPIDYLKLDRAFVKDIEVDPNDAVICAAAIGLAHSMKLKVVAEGVESTAQAVYLNDKGVDLMQGFLFSQPVQRDSVPTLLTQRRQPTMPSILHA